MATKRSPNAYALFAEDQRPKLIQEHPNWTFGEYSKRVGAAWKELSEAQRNVYKQKAEDCKNSTPVGAKPKPKSKPQKAQEQASSSPMVAAKPKRALSAYMFFMKDQTPKIKQEHPDASFADIGRHVSAKWKTVTPAAREKYDAMAIQDKKRYQTELARLQK